MTTMLKFQDTDVLEFDFDENIYVIHDADFLPFLLRDRIQPSIGMEHLSMNERINALIANRDAMMEFFMNRSIDIGRTNAKHILNTLGLPQQISRENSLRIMFLCKGLSASDDYWFSSSANEAWKDVCLRDNPLHETLAHVALFGDTTASITGEIRTPELTNQGAYPKAWRREDGVLYLQKGSRNDRAAEQEVCTSNLLDCTNVPHVRYWLEEKEGKKISVCESMCNDAHSIVPAHELILWCERTGRSMLDEVCRIDGEGFHQMLVTDYLISNPDRHGKNWGFYLDASTGRLDSLHPLFDHNLSFDPGTIAHPEGGYSLLFPKRTKMEAALESIEKCEFHFTSRINESCFLEEYHAESFRNRCKKLGLHPAFKKPYPVYGNSKSKHQNVR